MPVVDGQLAQVDWSAAAKKPPEPLTAAGRALREEARRASLTAFAPTMVLNEWAAEEPHGALPVVDLPDLHPVAAQGVLDWVNHTQPFPHEWWLMVYRAIPSIKASLNRGVTG